MKKMRETELVKHWHVIFFPFWLIMLFSKVVFEVLHANQTKTTEQLLSSFENDIFFFFGNRI